MVYVIQVCWQLVSRIRTSWSFSQAVSKPVLCPSSSVFLCTHSNGICHTGLLTACEQDQDVLILLTSCQQTCMTYTIAVCTGKNSWWWTEELSETCRVLFQSKFEELMHLVGFIIRFYHTAISPERQMNINICIDVTPWSLLCMYRLPACNHQPYDKVFCN